MKLFSLTVAAAAIATALVGIGSASATTLCKEQAQICPAGQRYPAGTVVEANLRSGTIAKLATNLGTVECKESTTAGETSEEFGTPLKGELTVLTFSSCKLGGTSCTVTVEHLPYLMEGVEIEPGNGFVTISDSGSGTPEALTQCGALINCRFGDEEVTLDGEGGAPAYERLLEVELVRLGGLFCPKTARLTAEYEIPNPNPIFLAAEP